MLKWVGMRGFHVVFWGAVAVLVLVGWRETCSLTGCGVLLFSALLAACDLECYRSVASVQNVRLGVAPQSTRGTNYCSDTLG